MDPLTIGLLGLGGLSAAQGLAGYFANKSQASASRYGIRQARKENKLAREFAQKQAGEANRILGGSTVDARRFLEQGYGQGLGALQAGNTQARTDLGTGYNSSLTALQGGYGNAQRGLESLTGLQQYGDIAGDYARTGGRLGSLLEGDLSRQNAYAGFEADPGYQFRLQQGEQAMNRAAAAQGNSLSGRQLMALQEHGQGLASQEFGNFANRRSALNALQAEGASQVDQGQMRAAMGLAGVGYGAQLQSSDLARQLGQGEAGLAGTYGSNLANLSATSGQQAAGMYTGLGSGQANLHQTLGANQASNLTGVGQMNAQLTGQMMPQYQAGVPYAGAGANAIAQTAGGLGNNLAFLGTMYGMNNGWFGGGGGGGSAPGTMYGFGQ